jgi:cytidylate kinase
MAVVTISGQVGTGAHDVGRLAAQRLQIDYIDQEILVAAARALGVSMESIISFDERTASLSERLAAMLRRFLERSAAAGAADPMLGSDGLDILLSRTYSEAATGEGPDAVPDDRYLAALSDIIRDLAGHDNVLIIGRGSQVILKDWPGALHVLLVAQPEERVADIARRQGLPEEKARSEVEGREKGRVNFHRKFFKVEVNDPSFYHLTLNTACFSSEETAEIISETARRVAVEGRPS